MATFKLLILSAVILCAHALPSPPVTRNTIFLDERLEGNIFEDVDIFSSEAITQYSTNVSDWRLPNTTRPVHYNVLWGIDIGRLTFSGTVVIQLIATQANVSEIVIHAHDLNIASLILQHETVTLPTSYSLQPEQHFLRVQMLNNNVLAYVPFLPVVYNLTITFGADLRDDMYGIYKSWFRNSWEDSVSWMASTQFQATAARFAFPCYDEPSFKATFDITIRRPTTHKSWSLTRIIETRNATTGYEDDIYNRTPPMSTYLLALIVAEYGSINVTLNGNLTYEVIARPGAIDTNQGNYSFVVGQELTSAMSNHTGIDYYSVDTNLKMTQASIPDFGAGAMENWGLITYREAYLMYDPNHTSDYYKQVIAYILSHEIAHMWFGNLVTCEFWDSLWLNEGFARYYQYFLTHWVEDYMGLDTRFINEQMHTSLLADSANDPHPLTNPNVGSPASVSAMFSTISYNKGAAIIRMTEHLLGFEVHRQGLQNYLNNKYLDIARPIDLFEALQNVAVTSGAIAEYGADFSVIDYYKSWTEVGGYPVLTVNVNHATGAMTVTQRRFNINTGYSSVNTNWIIPVTFATARNPDFNNTKPSHIIRKSVSVIDRGTVGDEWVVFNKQQTGYYRVNYDDYTWDLIVLALRGANRTQIHEYNRAQIVDDVFQFARAGLMNYTRAFNILSFLANETEYAPWLAAITNFNWLRNRLAGTTYLTPLENQIREWSTTVMNGLTYYPVENESFMRAYLRWQLAPVLCSINVPACKTAATAQLQALLVNGTEVTINSRNWVYCNGLREGTEADFNDLWLRYQRHNVYTEKVQLLQFLGCTPHNASLNTFLTNIVTENYIIRPQDYTVAFNGALTGNEGNTQIVFTFIQNHLQAVINAFGSAATPLSNVASRLRTVQEVNTFVAWVQQNQAALGDSYDTILRNAEITRQSIAWVSEVQDDLNSYFVNGDDDITASTAANVPVTNPSTVTPPELVEPETPDLPDSAVTAVLSVFAVMFAFAANMLVYN